jgi:hypothetical protein
MKKIEDTSTTATSTNTAMKKITIRKAGPIRLTTAACSHYPSL